MRSRKFQSGFTLLEMMVSAAIFVTICAAIFGLLNVSQMRYKTDTQVLNSFQEARLAIDQITRDVNDAGFPSPNTFDVLPASAAGYAQSPFAWNPNYPATPCVIGACTSPGNYDLIIETSVNGVVSWIRYQLVGTTLNSGVVAKTVGADPLAATGAVMVPYVSNVMNNAPGGQIATLNANFPGLFPGGAAVPIFSYTCDNGVGINAPVPCAAAGANNNPLYIRDVNITLIVLSTWRDAQSQHARAVSLSGRGHRINPNSNQ